MVAPLESNLFLERSTVAKILTGPSLGARRLIYFLRDLLLWRSTSKEFVVVTGMFVTVWLDKLEVARHREWMSWGGWTACRTARWDAHTHNKDMRTRRAAQTRVEASCSDITQHVHSINIEMLEIANDDNSMVMNGH